ncbi:MAG: hypothetical protein GF311_05605 [Candidatus Lokiarchaeota archaeon]|nr:hypothetical protein [Candidatus Lokiarchaeota archaeon]
MTESKYPEIQKAKTRVRETVEKVSHSVQILLNQRQRGEGEIVRKSLDSEAVLKHYRPELNHHLYTKINGKHIRDLTLYETYDSIVEYVNNQYGFEFQLRKKGVSEHNINSFSTILNSLTEFLADETQVNIYHKLRFFRQSISQTLYVFCKYFSSRYRSSIKNPTDQLSAKLSSIRSLIEKQLRGEDKKARAESILKHIVNLLLNAPDSSSDLYGVALFSLIKFFPLLIPYEKLSYKVELTGDPSSENIEQKNLFDIIGIPRTYQHRLIVFLDQQKKKLLDEVDELLEFEENLIEHENMLSEFLDNHYKINNIVGFTQGDLNS